HHPDLAVRARRDGHGVEADRDRTGMGQVADAIDGEDLEPIVGRVDREETATVGRQREGTDLTALEFDERGGTRGGDRDENEGGSQGPPGHLALGTSTPGSVTITYSPEAACETSNGWGVCTND